MAEREIDILGDAIANTEKEIFEDAIGKTATSKRGDDPADRSLEEMGEGLEGQHEDDAGEEGETDEQEADGEVEAGADDKGEDRDDKGRFKAKSEDKGDDDKPDAKAEQTEQEPEAKAKGAIPPGRLREQTEKATAAEARAKAAEEALAKERTEREATAREVADLKAKFEGFTLATRQPPKVEAKKEIPAKPDMFADPEGYEKWQDDRRAEEIAAISQSFEARLVESSMSAAADTHGDAFQKAYQAVTALDRNDPGARATVQRIWKSSNPGAALMTWHRQQETLREVGPDPLKFKERIASETREALMKDPEFRKQLLEDLKAEAAGSNGGQARHTTKLPKSLNGASGGQSAQRNDPSMFDNSDRAIFESAFDT